MKSTNIQKACTNRSTLVFGIFVFLFFLILAKLFDTQVLKRGYWQAVAFEQHFGESEVPSIRGDILSSDYTLLAVNSSSYDLYIDPAVFEGDFNDLKPVFDYLYKKHEGVDEEDEDSKLINTTEKKKIWEDAISDKKMRFRYLQKGLSDNQKKYIESLNIDALGFNSIGKRSYSSSEIFSHILGIVGKDEGGKSVGYFGLEGYYDGDLSGVSGRIKQERSALGSPIIYADYDNVKELNGSSIVTTIDQAIQTIIFTDLKNAVEDFGATSGVVAVVNPKTGAIIAMANYPSYNPENYGEYYTKDPDIFVNKAISSTYEPGSVIKAFTMAAAIDMGVVTPNTTVVDSGPVEYSGHLVDNWDKKHHGEITMYQVLQLSNNIGASWVGTKVGDKNLYKYFKNFGLGEKLGIDLEGEESGELRNNELWSDIDLAAASFGQGFSATPLQVLMGFSAIANQGVLMKPYLVKEITLNDEKVINEPKELHRVISKESANTMVDMLTKAVSGGEAKYFVSKSYNVAGKTGTAQIAEKGQYLAESTNATFVGFLPNYPEFVMLVKLEKPTSSVYASETAVPLWMSIAEKVANYYGLPPDKYE